jgi:hypothetical protein
MRRFKADRLKEHQAMKPVEEVCNEGITKEKMQLCLKNETNASRLCICVRNMEEHLQDLGMEPVHDIIIDDRETINML